MPREPRLFRSGAEGDYLARFKRVIHIDQQLRAGRHPSKAQLAEQCGVSPKTIQRDLDALRDELGAPVEYVPARRGYAYTDARFAIPAAVLGERDLFALMVSENAVAQYEGTPLHDHLRRAFERILNVLPGEILDRHELAARAIHFGGLPPAPIDPATWSTLVGAIHERVAIELLYQKGDEPEPVPRVLHPYQLVTRDRDWFLVAHHPEVGRELLYYLPRIHAVRPLDEEFELRDGFDAERFQARSFNAMQGPGEPRPIRLRFAPEAAYLARERPWAGEQLVEPDPDVDGALRVSFRSAALFEIERQVLRYRGLVEVLEPPELRDAVRETAQRIAERHAPRDDRPA